jgi:NAD(P)-dependent dehydrogenase (short-subunit alcohol dehydrogenase family)
MLWGRRRRPVEVTDKVIVVTGGGNGIGRALCRRFAAEGAKAVIVADLDAAAAVRVAGEIGGTAVATDVTREAAVADLVHNVMRERGRIDLFCSNAGIAMNGDEHTADIDWQRCWNVNVMAHVYAARAVVPGMLAQGSGYLLQTVSAAGLLTHPESATYAVTKHGALAFAEWLSIRYGDQGIRVSAVCPQGVRTDMLTRAERRGRPSFLSESAIEPEAVAEAVMNGIADERFLILPHPDVAEYVRRRAIDHDRWLRGMRRLRSQEM